MALIINHDTDDISIVGGGAPTLDGVSVGGGGGQTGFAIDEANLGAEPTAGGTDAIAIGDTASASGNDGICIGADTDATGFNSVAVGNSAQATSFNNVVVGPLASASAAGATSIGYLANAQNNEGVALGYDSDCRANHGVAIGARAAADGANSVSIGGASSTGDAPDANADASVAIGENTSTTGAATGVVFTSGNIGAISKAGMMCLWADTSDATQTELDSTDGGFMTAIFNGTIMFRAYVVAKRFDVTGENAAYVLTGVLDNDAGTTALTGTVTKEVIAEDVAGWDVVAEADGTNGRLAIKVTGEAAKSIRWLARIEFLSI
jgi:hypothetical protein